jgi:hypothetical protein
LKNDALQPLGDFLRKSFTDPRRANRTVPRWSLLVFIAMALFAGRDNLAAIWIRDRAPSLRLGDHQTGAPPWPWDLSEKSLTTIKAKTTTNAKANKPSP